MGVRGLTTFINREKRFYENYQLHSTKLVIDGCGLSPSIYFDNDLNIDPGNHGGEHQTFYMHCTQFFRNMLSCGIECCVVFDGSYDKDGIKFERLKERAQESIDAIKEMNETPDTDWLIGAEDESGVLVTAMDDLGIQYVSSKFEADRDIAVLANEFKCPVLGQDSDFFIMNIHKGYIPLDSLNWKRICSYSNESAKTAFCQPRSSRCQANQNYLLCKRFRQRKFCTYFQIMPSIMPLFASLSGNDYIKSFNLKEFYEGIKRRHQKPDGRRHPHRKGYWRFCDLLHHLTFFTTVDECIEEVLMYVSVDERSKVKAVLKESCSMYDVTSHSDVVQLFREQLQNAVSKPNDVQNSSPSDSSKDEDDDKERVIIPAICRSILRQRTLFQAVGQEKLSEPRATACCDNLLRIIAGMTLKNEISGEVIDGGGKLSIDVFHREGYTLTCTKMEPEWNVPGFGKVPFYKEIHRVSESSRRSLLYAALKVCNICFNKIPESFHLILLASVYCYKNANPPISENILHALVLGWIQGVAWYQDNANRLKQEGQRHTEGEEFDISWDGCEVQTVLQNYKPLTNKSLQKSLDFDVSHAFMQWIACHNFTKKFNILLQKLLPTLDIRIWYNGILKHNLYKRLNEIHPSKHQNWIKYGLLLDAPTAYRFYQDIMSFFYQNLTVPGNLNVHSWPLPSRVATGQQHKGSQTEIKGHSGTLSTRPKEAVTSDNSRGNSGRKKRSGSRKSRKKNMK